MDNFLRQGCDGRVMRVTRVSGGWEASVAQTRLDTQTERDMLFGDDLLVCQSLANLTCQTLLWWKKELTGCV
jgi:hypothetical protein